MNSTIAKAIFCGIAFSVIFSNAEERRDIKRGRKIGIYTIDVGSCGPANSVGDMSYNSKFRIAKCIVWEAEAKVYRVVPGFGFNDEYLRTEDTVAFELKTKEVNSVESSDSLSETVDEIGSTGSVIGDIIVGGGALGGDLLIADRLKQEAVERCQFKQSSYPTEAEIGLAVRDYNQDERVKRGIDSCIRKLGALPEAFR